MLSSELAKRNMSIEIKKQKKQQQHNIFWYLPKARQNDILVTCMYQRTQSVHAYVYLDVLT